MSIRCLEWQGSDSDTATTAGLFLPTCHPGLYLSLELRNNTTMTRERYIKPTTSPGDFVPSTSPVHFLSLSISSPS